VAKPGIASPAVEPAKQVDAISSCSLGASPKSYSPYSVGGGTDKMLSHSSLQLGRLGHLTMLQGCPWSFPSASPGTHVEWKIS